MTSSSSDEPVDPVGDMTVMAIHLHELFESFMAAGFTRMEALQLVKQTMAGARAAD